MTATSDRSFETSAGSNRGARPEEFVHALAQLPQEVSAEVSCPPAEADRIELLASAYAINGRVALDTTGDGPCRFIRNGTPADIPSWNALGELVEALWPADAPSPPPMVDDGILVGHRVAMVTNLPTHYRAPLFARLAARLLACGGDLVVLFLGSDDKGRSWIRSTHELEFEHEFLGGVRIPLRRRRPPVFAPRLTAALRACQPTMVIAPGFAPAATIPCLLFAARQRIPAGLWSGETAAIASRRRGRPAALRSSFAQRASFGIAYGSLARQYLLSLSPDLPAVIGRNTSVLAPLPRDRPGQPSPVELVMVADLALPGKGAEVALEALRQVPELDCRLTIVGSRPGGRLEAEALGDPRVSLVGSVSPERVQETLSGCDVFLFPSRIDVFGLALVEAMAGGLASIVSPIPGAVADLAVPGANCLVANEPAEWASRIHSLVTDHPLRARLGGAAQRTVARRWTIDHAVESMLAGARLGALVSARRAV